MENLLVDIKSGDKIIIEVDGIKIGGPEKVIISGPCSIENFETMYKIAKGLKAAGVNILRGGAFKPRTSPYDFQGLEFEGLNILNQVGREFNMPVVSEIMDIRDLDRALKLIDIVQIGSRNMYNYPLLKEVGKLNVPILLKRGMGATLKEWIMSAEYIMSEGNSNVILCERGIRTFEDSTRNTLDLNTVCMLKNNFRLPIIVDPSHAAGLREIVPNLSYAAISAGADGLMIESHINPLSSVSDSRQTVSIQTMINIVNKVKCLNINL